MKTILICTLLILCGLAQAAPAHRHGEAELDVALEGDTLHILLTGPLEALVGFERAPRSEAERRALNAMAQTLRDAERMFALPAQAGCSAAGVTLDSPVLDGQPVSGGHADMAAHYHLKCKEAGALRELRTGLFEAFPRLGKIKLQFVGPDGQRAATLTRKNPRFAW